MLFLSALLTACSPLPGELPVAPIQPSPVSPVQQGKGCDSGVSAWFTDRSGAHMPLELEPDSALSLLEPGTLTICPGIHSLALTLDADITVLGEGAVLSGSGTHTPLSVGPEADTVIIEGLTLIDGAAHHTLDGAAVGGAFYCGHAATVSLHRVTITDSTADIGGGAYLSGCSLSLTDSTLSHNSASLGSGLALVEGAAVLEGTHLKGNAGQTVLSAQDMSVLQLLDTNLTANEAEDATVYIASSTNIALWGVSIAAQPAVGLHLSEVSHTLIGETLFSDNSGAIFGTDSEVLRVFDTVFQRNAASEPGGAIHSGFEEITLSRSTFTRNTAPLGDAIYLSDGAMVGVEVSFTDQPDEDVFVTALREGYRFGEDVSLSCSETGCTP